MPAEQSIRFVEKHFLCERFAQTAGIAMETEAISLIMAEKHFNVFNNTDGVSVFYSVDITQILPCSAVRAGRFKIFLLLHLYA